MVRAVNCEGPSAPDTSPNDGPDFDRSGDSTGVMKY
jgi:hypothetical protein